MTLKEVVETVTKKVRRGRGGGREGGREGGRVLSVELSYVWLMIIICV